MAVKRSDVLSRAFAVEVQRRVGGKEWRVVGLLDTDAIPEHVRKWLREECGVSEPILIVAEPTGRA